MLDEGGVMTMYMVIYVKRGDEFNWQVDPCHDILTARARHDLLKPQCVQIAIYERVES